MIEVISGLHSCKPENAPEAGQVKNLAVIEQTSSKGKPYLKIKSTPPDKGGLPYRIVKAEPTGYTDSYGNISFNLEIEKVATMGGAMILPPGTPAPTAQQPQAQDNRSQRIERQSARRDAIEFHRLECTFTGDTEVKPSLDRVKEIMTTLEGWLDEEAW